MISKIVRRYSKALYEETIQLGINKDVINDVTRLLTLIDENKILRNFFSSPLINKLKKKKVIKILKTHKGKIFLDNITYNYHTINRKGSA